MHEFLKLHLHDHKYVHIPKITSAFQLFEGLKETILYNTNDFWILNVFHLVLWNTPCLVCNCQCVHRYACFTEKQRSKQTRKTASTG